MTNASELGDNRIKTKLTADAWQTGRIIPEDFTFDALVFREPSRFGIDGGEVSKLILRDRKGHVIANFDGSWDEKPEFGTDAALAVERIVAFYRVHAASKPFVDILPPNYRPQPIKGAVSKTDKAGEGSPHEQQIKRGRSCIMHYMALKESSEFNDSLEELLTDLMHWADEYGFPFEADLRKARRSYRADKNRGGD